MNEGQLRNFLRNIMEEPTPQSIKNNLDSKCIKFVDFMFKDHFWNFYNNFFHELLFNNKMILSVNKNVSFETIEKLHEKLFKNNYKYLIKPIAEFLNQWSSHQQKFSNFSKIIRDFQREGIIKPTGEYFWKCNIENIIGITNKKNNYKCPLCKNECLVISQNILTENIRNCLNSNQFLEMYANKSLTKSDWKPITWSTKENKKIGTSLRFSVDPETVEIDSIATKGQTLIICEAKNQDIKPNDIAKKESKINYLLNTIKKEFNEVPETYFTFIVNGNIDPNAIKYQTSKSNNKYKIKIFSRNDLPNLVNRFKDLIDLE